MAKQLGQRDLKNITRAAKNIQRLSASGRRDVAQRALKVLQQSNRRSIRGAVGAPGNALLGEAKRIIGTRSVGQAAQGLFDATIGQGPAGDLSREVIRYARGGFKSFLVKQLLGRLGPVGQAIEFLLGRSPSNRLVPDSAIRDAIKLLQAAGLEVRVPASHSAAPVAIGSPNVPFTQHDQPAPTTDRGGIGGRSRGPAQPGGPSQHGPAQPINQPAGNNLPVGSLPANKGISMELVVGSTNVYAFGYQPETQTLRVQFLGATINRNALKGKGHKGKSRVKGKLGRTVTNTRRGPGPLYDYQNVPPRIFERFKAASSKGKAVWDELRVRGSAYGHKFDYQLVAASVVDVVVPEIRDGKLYGGRKVGSVTYVPRKAVGPGQFQARSLLQGQGTRVFRSLLPSQGMRDTRDRKK